MRKKRALTPSLPPAQRLLIEIYSEARIREFDAAEAELAAAFAKQPMKKKVPRKRRAR